MLATVAVAAVVSALAAVGAILWNRARHRKKAHALSSAVAFSLRRQLISWLEEKPWPSGKDDSKRQARARELSGHFDRAEERVQRMLEASALAPAKVSEQAKQAAARFWEATRYLNEAAAASLEGMDPDPNYKIDSWYRFRQSEAAQGFDHAEILLRECVATLGVVIEKELLRASGMLPRPQEPEEE
jgi:hypothetical protein